MKRIPFAALPLLLGVVQGRTQPTDVERLEVVEIRLAGGGRGAEKGTNASRTKAMAGFVLENDDKVFGSGQAAGQSVAGPKLDWFLEPQSTKDGTEMLLVVHNEGEKDVEIVRS